MKTKRRHREILLNYIIKENTDPTEDSIIPQSDYIREEMKSEHIRIRVTPSEKRYLMFFAKKRQKSLSDLLLNGAFLLVFFNKFGVFSVSQVVKALKVFKSLKKNAGTSAINSIVDISDDDNLDTNLWI